MKKKIILLLLVVLVGAVSVYLYVYKGHRDIATEEANFNLTVAILQKEFTADEKKAYQKYQDKTIQLTGQLTAIDNESKAITVDEKMFATFVGAVPGNLVLDKPITVKGRFLGYDELLEEFKMDQITIIE